MQLHDLETAWARREERCAVDFCRVERLARELAGRRLVAARDCLTRLDGFERGA